MNKNLITHIIVIVVAVIAGYYLALQLADIQNKLSPEKKDMTKAPVAGFQKISADIKWMLFIQYLGSRNTVDEKNVSEVNNRLESLIKYDPNFEPLYREGVLTISSADPDKTLEILAKACGNEYLKNNWQIPFYAGFVASHCKKTPDYALAADFFLKAITRTADKEVQPYLVSNYVRAKARLEAPKYENDENLALLHVLYNEWNSQASSQKEQSGKGVNQVRGVAANVDYNSGLISNIVERLLKSAQDVKNNKASSEEALKFVKKVREEILAGQHLCEQCLTPYAPGEKFCAKCGNKVVVYGICPDCGAVLKGDFCSSCGYPKTKSK